MKSWEQRLGDVLTALRLDSIKNKIVVLALLATLVPAFSTAVPSYVQNRRALTESLEGELRGIGSQTARELDLWIKERFYDVRIFVSSFEVSENLDRIPRGGPGAAEALTRLTNYLTGVQGRFGDYAELLVIDVEGEAVASSSVGLRDVDLPVEWMPALRQGETTLGEPYWDEAIGAVAVTIAQPIESAGGGFLGVLLATLTFDALQDLLAGFAPGEGGHVDLITGDGRTIVASAPAPALEPALPDGTLAQLAAAAGGTIEYVGLDGSSVLGTLTDLPRLDWAVVTQMPSAEAYAQIAQLRDSTLLLVSFLLLSVGLIAYYLGLFIVRPLGRLTAAAGAVTGGDLSVDLPVTGRGEVGYLTEVFNAMVAQLRRSREELDEASTALREHNVELERLSMTDALTGLYNRRYVMNEFDKEIHRASRHHRTLAVLMMDVDRFKQYNDSYGHLAGDQVLMGMGVVIEDATREPDVPARYGGEEFIVLLPDCDLEGAIDAAERIRARLGEEVFEGGAVTVSIGAAEYPEHGDTTNALIGAADAALYEAKDGGRDRVVAAARVRAEKAVKDPMAKRRTSRKAAPKKSAAKKAAAPKKKVAAEKKSS